MFYLKEFFLIHIKLGIRGLFFLVTTILLSLSLHFRNDLHLASDALSVKAFVKPYFTVFFDQDVNVNKIKERLSFLPQVAQLQDVATQEGLQTWWKILTEMGESPSNSGTAYQGLRVLMNQNIAQSDASFIIKSIIQMAGGEDHLTTSDIKYPKEEKFLSMHPFFRILSKFHEWTFIFPLAVLWMVLFYLNLNSIKRSSFIVEHFQRKKMVSSKILGAGFIFILTTTLFLSFIFSIRFDILGLIISFVFFATHWALTLRGSQWIREE